MGIPFRLIIYVLFFLSSNLTAQKAILNSEEHRFVPRDSENMLLDGTFIKETALTRNVEYNNGYRPYYSNLNFTLSRRSFPNFKSIDETKSPCFDSILFKSKKISSLFKKDFKKNFVLIEPTEKYYVNKKNNDLLSSEQYFIIDEHLEYCNESSYNILFPYSLRFYINPADIEIIPNQDSQILDSNFRIQNKEELLQSFLFSKYEVSNKEYREFVNWVRDSIAREALYENVSKEFKLQTISGSGDTSFIINWEKELDWKGEAEAEVLYFMFLPDYERFYDKRSINSKGLNYKSLTISTLNIYPDTMCWVEDFQYSFNEPLTNSYFWHPAYDDYPVVGINYWQVQAFLDWKTKQHQKKLNKEGLAIKINYSLPNDFQWDLVATAKLNADTVQLFNYNYQNYSDKDWVTNLKIKNTFAKVLDSIGTENGKKYFTTQEDKLYLLQNNANRFDGNFVEDKSLNTAKVNIDELDKKIRNHPLIALNRDALGICYMGANVSEWLDNDYKNQWKPIFDLRQKQLATSTNESIKILSSIERYYDQKNAPDGKLVRGGNWYDERFTNLNGKNISGMNAKTFVSPDSAHSTIGFRYVITFEEK